jgi:hypothetical protein
LTVAAVSAAVGWLSPRCLDHAFDEIQSLGWDWLTLDDRGVHTFADTGLGTTTLLTHGHQTITATDTAENSITGDVTVRVRRAGPDYQQFAKHLNDGYRRIHDDRECVIYQLSQRQGR